MSTQKLVFVPNRGPHDYSDAWNFGKLVFCTSGTVNRKDTATMQAELERAMQDSDAADYILITSLSTLCAIACAIFARQHGRLNLLIFEDSQYIERSLTFNKQGHNYVTKTTDNGDVPSSHSATKG